MNSKKLCELKHARIDHQKENMARAIKNKVCLFCQKHIGQYHRSPIERKGKHWLITKNDYPYDGAQVHYLFIATRHIDSLAKVSPLAMAELAGHIKWLNKKFDLKGGSIVIRFGESDRSSSTITHLHGHLIAGTKESSGTEPLMVAVGFKKKLQS